MAPWARAPNVRMNDSHAKINTIEIGSSLVAVHILLILSDMFLGQLIELCTPLLSPEVLFVLCSQKGFYPPQLAHRRKHKSS